MIYLNRYLTAILLTLAMLFIAIPYEVDAQQTLEKPIDRMALIEAVQTGGYILYIRHERTEVPSRADDYTRPANDCRAQRNLSVSGVAAAHETGTVLRTIGVPIHRIISSPMCRSTETARYMFGVNYDMDARLMHHDPGENSQRDMAAAVVEAKAVISEVAATLNETNVVLVGHGGTIRQVTGLSVSEGEIAVLSVSDNGAIEPLGQFTGSDLGFYARRKAAQSHN